MECFAVLVVLLAAVVIATLTLVLGQSGRGRWNEPFAAVARRRHGQQTWGGWLSQPLVRFRYGATYARLTAYPAPGSGGRQVLELVVQIPELRFDLTITTRRPTLPLALHNRGLLAVPFDWADFSDRYITFVADAEDARLALSSGVRQAIGRLAVHPDRGEISVSLRAGWLFVQKVCTSRNSDAIDQFVDEALGLYDQLLLTRSAGIEFVGGAEVQLLEEAHCAICGESLAQAVVVCRRCNTPHHRDCWDYAGGCSTYGCRETVYVLPATGRASDYPPTKPK